MAQPRSNATGEIPLWLKAAGSVLIILHLLTVAGAVLAVPSGPWFAFGGPNEGPPPLFAQIIKDVTGFAYGNWIRMTDSYRFPSNHTATLDAQFEVRLKDDKGQLLATLRFPD